MYTHTHTDTDTHTYTHAQLQPKYSRGRTQELPKKIEVLVPCPLSSMQRSVYKHCLEENFAVLTSDRLASVCVFVCVCVCVSMCVCVYVRESLMTVAQHHLFVLSTFTCHMLSHMTHDAWFVSSVLFS